ncbi:VOC family protein [Streptantibioticus ferralitis]|uniref:VOC family protein n=1 Tax=Streptantibioticus ferralitis TaxID=236510 RepID=A0ABT5Z8H7_9ACTN|nr:VOC family protein [Streptantibioticus ferralitis]MDF2260137.1 VOC family protein [Streptantibioticus ferralitis]
MSEVTAAYPVGTPCWVDLMVGDQQAALDSYHELFGWSGEIGPEEMGGYTVCTLHGKAVAGIGKAMAMDGQAAPPTAWTTYLSVDDLDEALRAVADNGGQVYTGPHDIPDNVGRMAVGADPTGGAFGLWQPLDFVGAQLVNEPGTLCWNELNSQDPQAAAAFYSRVLGVSFTPYKVMPGYYTMHAGGRTVGGLQGLDQFPEGTPSHWLAYFSVNDTDATVDQVTKRGGAVLQKPFEIPAGRMAVVRDSQGGVFGVIAMPPTA